MKKCLLFYRKKHMDFLANPMLCGEEMWSKGIHWGHITNWAVGSKAGGHFSDKRASSHWLSGMVMSAQCTELMRGGTVW